MKKFICLCAAILLCLSTAMAASLYVPKSSGSLPDIPTMPECPEIIRVQTTEDSVTITLTQPLPDNAQVTAWLRDADYCHYFYFAEPGDGNTYTATAPVPMPGDEWMNFDISWYSGNVRAEAHYNAAGGLKNVSCYDADFNEYVFDNDGYFFEFADADNSVRARFNTRGVMTSYGYEAFPSTTVWFTPEGEVVYAEYDDGDGGMVGTWEAGYGWYVLTSAGRVKVKINTKSPWDARPLMKKTPADEEDAPETIWYPDNTVTVCGLTLQEVSSDLPDKWYNVLPVDLTKDGRQTYYLMISNMHYIGRCYVDVWGDEVTVSYSLLDNSAIRPLSSYGRWFTSLSQITAASIESEADSFTFGQPMSIGDDLGGADTALLFIRCKATYYQPFRDGTALTRYWRNRPEWKEFREGLQELLPRVEK